MKIYIIATTLLISANAALASPIWGDILRNGDGSILYLSVYDGTKVCQKFGGRLPTIREFAELSHTLGAVGVESSYNSSNYPIYQEKCYQDVLDFYYNPSGYQRPNGDLGTYYFRSSSYHRDPAMPYVFFGDSGHINFGGNGSGIVTRCVFDK